MFKCIRKKATATIKKRKSIKVPRKKKKRWVEVAAWSVV
jgi:hypothetical protein